MTTNIIQYWQMPIIKIEKYVEIYNFKITDKLIVLQNMNFGRKSIKKSEYH